MEIVVVGRHTEVADRFRRHVEDKLTKVTQLAPYARRVDVEVTREKNPRLAEVRERVELTVRDKGPVIRAEAAADDRFGALDMALDKLTERLRRSRERRKEHRRRTNGIMESVDVRPYDEVAAEEAAKAEEAASAVADAAPAEDAAAAAPASDEATGPAEPEPAAEDK